MGNYSIITLALAACSLNVTGEKVYMYVCMKHWHQRKVLPAYMLRFLLLTAGSPGQPCCCLHGTPLAQQKTDLCLEFADHTAAAGLTMGCSAEH